MENDKVQLENDKVQLENYKDNLDIVLLDDGLNKLKQEEEDKIRNKPYYLKNEDELFQKWLSKHLKNEDLDALKYSSAIIFDKRNYCQYYCSLIKKKHLFLFSLIYQKKYNILSLKLSFLLLSFSVYYTINGFFLNQKIISEIYIENEAFNFIVQMPVIGYSTLISGFIIMLLKWFFSYEKHFIFLKEQKCLKYATEQSIDVIKCIRYKIIAFIIVDFALLLFFWYYLSCFCAVLYNIQIILLLDTLISFGFSLIYPFALSLIPALLRIYALREKDQGCMFKTSQLLEVILN